MFVLPLVTHVFFWIIIILHRRLHRGLVWLKYSFKMCPTWFMLLNLFFLTIYKPMRIHGNNATQYGNNRLLPINRMTVSSDTYCVRATAAGSNIFPYHSTDIGELSIHGLQVYSKLACLKLQHIPLLECFLFYNSICVE